MMTVSVYPFFRRILKDVFFAYGNAGVLFLEQETHDDQHADKVTWALKGIKYLEQLTFRKCDLSALHKLFLRFFHCFRNNKQIAHQLHKDFLQIVGIFLSKF